jgi:hypothetical protein
MQQAENHAHDHDGHHDHADWQQIQECIVDAGVMDAQEIREALSALRSGRKVRSDVLPPYLLTAMPGHAPTAALRWDWDSKRAHEFAEWCMHTLRQRFHVDWQIDWEDENEQQGPHYLRMMLGEQQERCDWRYLNQNRWMGAFCTIANRLLNPQGLTVLSLETGWFDTVVVFCRSSHAEALLHWFPEAE